MQEENLFTPNCIRTVSGKYVNVFEPTPDMICIEDIAHALSNQCRFGGHLPRFYSVAEHSLNCSYLIDDPELKLEALMHDASEAYLLDIPSPIKKNLTNYKQIEDGLMKVIFEKFGLSYPLHEKVKEVDAIVLQTEWNCLMLQLDHWKLEMKYANQIKEDFIKMFNYYGTLKIIGNIHDNK